MVKIELQRNVALLRGQMAALYEMFQQAENRQSQNRVKDLAIKLQKQEYSIAFCGHFSAGKSSMINTLMGENILPSSPIPTSANLVKIKSGEDYAKVYFKEEVPHLYPAPYDYEKVKSYCKDGDQIQSIEISYSKTSIPQNVTIMDTPGIDSTDDAHRIATESALHLADLVFYVMDYNHVQSELNFLFTKELMEAGKEVYLVINQIDKHREDELSFLDFQRSVVESFASWGVKPTRIFYTSLKKENHPNNQYTVLRQFIEEKIYHRVDSLPDSIFQSLKKVGVEHLDYLAQMDEAKLNELNGVLEELSEEEKTNIPDIVEKLHHQRRELKTKLQQNEKKLYNGLDDLLDNAYLMPFTTRDLAQEYLEARQPDFKIGLFFSKQKTEQERSKRLEDFYKDLSEKVTSQLDWHIKELFLKFLKDHDLHDDRLIAAIQQFKVQFDQELLRSEVKPGARLTGDYVLKYTKDVTEAIKRKTKEQIAPIQTSYLELLKQKQVKQEQTIEYEINSRVKYIRALEGISLLNEKRHQVQNKMDGILSGQFDAESYQAGAKGLATEDIIEVKMIRHDLQMEEEKVEKRAKERKAHVIPNKSAGNDLEFDQLIAELRFSSQQVEHVPGFKKMALELSQKADRLQNQSFTVALFGAFSAGKSSFANALIGDRLLPVSPNPTTAAINKIMPVDDRHPHGLVLVKLKSFDVLMTDVNRSLAAFERKSGTLEGAVSQAQQVVSSNRNVDAYEKTHLAFLQAFAKGIGRYQQQLGETIQTNLAEFSSFVANEEKSCLVEWIEVYYDCDLTRKGITLVDTPGADSINARHTGVAFEYIKNSDAILFVTYYNHAFSKADREFLIQLGRVKDTFALDKMFFIVNAIDLAHNEEEMDAVLDYVEEQLVTYGIRQPHLYPVSSMLALQEKIAKEKPITSKLQLFEESFYAFIDHDLREIAMNSAKIEQKRLVSQLQSFIHSAEADADTKEQNRIQLLSEKEQVLAFIYKQNDSFAKDRLSQETEELVYYIKQRVFLRFGDFLKESFNPAVLKDDGRNLKKAIHVALDQFLEDFGYDFAQELRATTLRLEAFIGKTLSQTQGAIETNLQEWNNELSLSPFEITRMESTDFETAFMSMDRQLFKKALSYFKNPKSFFEKNERKYLGDEIEKVLQAPVDQYLEAGKAQLIQHYSLQLESVFQDMLKHVKDEIEEYYQGALASLSNQFPIDELKRIQQSLVSGTEKRQND